MTVVIIVKRITNYILVRSFKREMKGYWHLFFLEAFIAHRWFTGETVPTFLRLLDGITFLVLAILLFRFASTNYLVINETEVLIKADFFVSKAVPISEIKQIKFEPGWVRHSRIELKNGSSILFRQGYLSAEAKQALLNLVKN